jgi:hypothetical protein
MFADVNIETESGGAATLIPHAALQSVGNRTVVYLADSKQPGRFLERDVRVGDTSGNDVAVLEGVQPGDRVVADGSFAVRAERDRLGLRATEPTGGRSGPGASSHFRPPQEPQGVRVLVTEKGYEPVRLTPRAGEPVRMTFLRTTDKTCGTEVVFPSLNIRRSLPLNQPVVVEFTPRTSGEIGFVCGINMLRGAVVAQ